MKELKEKRRKFKNPENSNVTISRRFYEVNGKTFHLDRHLKTGTPGIYSLYQLVGPDCYSQIIFVNREKEFGFAAGWSRAEKIVAEVLRELR